MTKASDNPFPSVLFQHTSNASITTPSPWDASRLFFDADGTLKAVDSGDSVSTISGGGITNVDDVVTSADKISFASNFSVSDQGSGDALVDIFFPGSSLSGDTELAYAEYTSGNINVTATTEGTAQSVVSAGSVAFDGSTRVKIEWYIPFAATSTSSGGHLIVVLYDDSTSIGYVHQMTSNGWALRMPVQGKRYLTPSNASHTYSIRVFSTAGTGSVNGGAGGAAGYMPAFIRITEVDSV